MLLNIKHVKFKNFFSFGAKWQNLELKEGTNLVIGYDQDNDRRNGAGKCLSGDTLIDIEINDKEIEFALQEFLKNS